MRSAMAGLATDESRGLLEIRAELAARAQDPGIVRRETKIPREARRLLIGQLRQRCPHFVDE